MKAVQAKNPLYPDGLERARYPCNRAHPSLSRSDAQQVQQQHRQLSHGQAMNVLREELEARRCVGTPAVLSKKTSGFAEIHSLPSSFVKLVGRTGLK